MSRTAGAIVAAAIAVVLAGGAGALAAVQLTSPSDADPNVSGPPPTLVVRSTPTSTPTETPTASPTPTATAPADGASGDGGSSGGTDGGSSGGSSDSRGGSGGGGTTPPPPPPPPPAEPPYTDADAIAAVLNRWGGVPAYGMCTASNYGSWGNHSTPPPPHYVGILGFEAGALPDGSGGWVKYYSCE